MDAGPAHVNPVNVAFPVNSPRLHAVLYRFFQTVIMWTWGANITICQWLSIIIICILNLEVLTPLHDMGNRGSVLTNTLIAGIEDSTGVPTNVVKEVVRIFTRTVPGKSMLNRVLRNLGKFAKYMAINKGPEYELRSPFFKCPRPECEVDGSAPDMNACRKLKVKVITPQGLKYGILQNRRCSHCARTYSLNYAVEKEYGPPGEDGEQGAHTRTVRNYYTTGQYEQTNLIFVQQGLYATKEYCKDLNQEMSHYGAGCKNLATVFNKTKAKDSHEDMEGSDRFLTEDGRELTNVFNLFNLMEKRLPDVSTTQRIPRYVPKLPT